MLLVKQCKHFTEAHNLCSLSLHMEDYWDMKDMEDTLETPVHSIFLSSSQHGLLFSLSLSFIFYSFYSLSSSGGSFWSPSGSSLPTLPSPSTPLRTRTWGISINNQPLRNCPNVSTKVQNQMNDISHTDPKWDIPLVAHDNAWTWTCSPKLAGSPRLDQPTLSSCVFSIIKQLGHIFGEMLLEKMLRQQLVSLEVIWQCWEGGSVRRVPSPLHRVLVHLQI